jgi:hypothetical protein
MTMGMSMSVRMRRREYEHEHEYRLNAPACPPCCPSLNASAACPTHLQIAGDSSPPAPACRRPGPSPPAASIWLHSSTVLRCQRRRPPCQAAQQARTGSRRLGRSPALFRRAPGPPGTWQPCMTPGRLNLIIIIVHNNNKCYEEPKLPLATECSLVPF